MQRTTAVLPASAYTITREDIRSSKMELILNMNTTTSRQAFTSSAGEVTPPRYSILTLTVVLSCIYGLALVFGIVWIIWLYIRRKTMFSLKNSQLDFNRDFYSTNSIN
jgi:hypothetical protein